MDVFDAIADPVRRDLLRTLTAGRARVVDLAAELPISRPAVSKHLRLLADAGLARSARQGRESVWELELRRLEEARRCLDLISAQWDVALDRLKAFVEEQE